MPILYANQTAIYQVATPNEFVAVVCSGASDVMLVSWIGPAGTSGQRTVRGTTSVGEDIGPFPNGSSVTFTAISGAPFYTAPAFAAPVQTLVSSSQSQSSDILPAQSKAVSASGQVVQGPCSVSQIKCTAGTAVTITLRDSVTQTVSAADTTSPQVFSATMSAGDLLKVPFSASFGLHATLGGTGPAFELEF